MGGVLEKASTNHVESDDVLEGDLPSLESLHEHLIDEQRTTARGQTENKRLLRRRAVSDDAVFLTVKC